MSRAWVSMKSHAAAMRIHGPSVNVHEIPCPGPRASMSRAWVSTKIPFRSLFVCVCVVLGCRRGIEFQGNPCGGHGDPCAGHGIFVRINTAAMRIHVPGMRFHEIPRRGHADPWPRHGISSKSIPRPWGSMSRAWIPRKFRAWAKGVHVPGMDFHGNPMPVPVCLCLCCVGLAPGHRFPGKSMRRPWASMSRAWVPIRIDAAAMGIQDPGMAFLEIPCRGHEDPCPGHGFS